MATKIRLKRMGKIRTPHYRIVVIDSRAKRDGQAIEEIGQYHPKSDPSEIIVNSERAQYWLGVGAQPTEAVVAIFKRSGDWQKFTGEKSPEGIDAQPTKQDKLELFNAALAEADNEPTTSAITTKGKKTDDADEASADEATDAAADEAPAEDAKVEEPADQAPAADTDSSAASTAADNTDEAAAEPAEGAEKDA